MIDIDCPWCQEEVQLPFPELREPEASFICAECGTSVAFVDEPLELDLAA
jgi:endogenous inhibitor of DNA gyrase (YacG/DUF329 family)